jgi:hypothetical protein
MTIGIARGDGGAAARKKDTYAKGHFQCPLVLYQMTLEVILGNFNVVPSQDGIHDFSSAICRWIAKSWIPAFAGMTGLAGQSP